MSRTGATVVAALCICCGGSDSPDATVATENRPPWVDMVSLLPRLPAASDSLSVTVRVQDPDRDDVSLEVAWYRNGGFHQKGVAQSLKPFSFAKGDRIHVVVHASDGVDSVSRTSEEVLIGNTAPHITSLGLSPETALADDVIRANVGATDIDGDEIEYRRIAATAYDKEREPSRGRARGVRSVVRRRSTHRYSGRRAATAYDKEREPSRGRARGVRWDGPRALGPVRRAAHWKLCAEHHDRAHVYTQHGRAVSVRGQRVRSGRRSAPDLRAARGSFGHAGGRELGHRDLGGASGCGRQLSDRAVGLGSAWRADLATVFTGPQLGNQSGGCTVRRYWPLWRCIRAAGRRRKAWVLQPSSHCHQSPISPGLEA